MPCEPDHLLLRRFVAARDGGDLRLAAQLWEQLISAEQDERRRLANELHDGAVQSMSGIALMLHALRSLREVRGRLPRPVTVMLNTDEEIGSPGSSSYFAKAATRHHLALLFEPAVPDGALVAERKGSGNFSLVVRGKARDVHPLMWALVPLFLAFYTHDWLSAHVF